MNIVEILKHKTISSIFEKQILVNNRKMKKSYNLFTVSSYTSHLENFHSDILASLFDKDGLHDEKDKFFKLFLSYLNKYYHPIDIDNYKMPIVSREIGRIDIWLRDELSKKAIIIENKINNAPDRENQLEDYCNYSDDSGYKTELIIYLSLNGTKKAPEQSNKDLKKIIVDIGAFTDTPDDLVNGWLKKCLQVCSNEDSRSFIYQYTKLIPHLANDNMDTQIVTELYDFICENQVLEEVNSLNGLIQKIPVYRADKFRNSITDISPFRKPYRYKPNYWLFENYFEDDNRFKLDVWFDSNGSASVVFWNPAKENLERELTTKKKLEQINMLSEFESKGFGGYRKDFSLIDFQNLGDLDNSVVKFVLDFMDKLRKINY